MEFLNPEKNKRSNERCLHKDPTSGVGTGFI